MYTLLVVENILSIVSLGEIVSYKKLSIFNSISTFHLFFGILDFRKQRRDFLE